MALIKSIREVEESEKVCACARVCVCARVTVFARAIEMHKQKRRVEACGSKPLYGGECWNPETLVADSASGGAYDYVKGVLGVKYAYTLELRPDSFEYNGFVVSASMIEPSTNEVFAGLSRVLQELKTKS